MKVATTILLLLYVCADETGEKKAGNQVVPYLQLGNSSLPGIRMEVSKFTNFTLRPGEFQVFYAVLGKQDALDLHRIHCVLEDVKRLRREGLHFLQITASNGRGSALFSLPESTSNGTPLYEGARLVHPLQVEDFQPNRSQIFAISVLSRSLTEVPFRIRIWNYDRSQYYVEVPSKLGSKKVLENQRAGYVRPLSYLLKNSGSQLVRVQLKSNDDLCARLVVTRKGANPYVMDPERQTDVDEKLHDMEFSSRLDLILRGDRVPSVVWMFIFVYSDDEACHLGAESRNVNHLKHLNISWSAEDVASFVMPISVLIVLYLLPIALMYVGVVGLSRAPLSSGLEDASLEGGGHEQLDSIAHRADYLTDATVGGTFSGFEDDAGENSGTARELSDNLEGSPPDDNAEIVPASRKERAVGTRCEDNEWSWTGTQFALVLLPVLSLVITVPSYAPAWTDDSCFHNYACSQPFWIFTSFNHIVSNVGYVLSSAIFIAFAMLRKSKFTPGHGAYSNYGLDICMGLCLLCESFASAVYHICPNSITYNLDTPFIEALCAVIVLKLYGNRHGIISARLANMAIALVIFLDSFVTMAAERSLTRPFVIVLPLIAVLAGMGWILVKNPKQRDLLDSGCLRSGPCSKFPLRACVASLLLNSVLAVVFVLLARSVQPNQIVTVICLLNTALYFLYYVVMKRICEETWCKFSRMCSVIAVLLWGAALYFFLIEETGWALTPAQSRARNQPCVLLSFFDHHDLWHLSSSLAALFSLMAVSTLDDAVSALPTDAMPIF